MQRTAISKLVRRGVQASIAATSSITRIARKTPLITIARQPIRGISTTLKVNKGLSPESENPEPKIPEDHDSAVGPAQLSPEQYNALSDEYMDKLVERLEELQEEREDVDVEYSVSKSPPRPYL